MALESSGDNNPSPLGLTIGSLLFGAGTLAFMFGNIGEEITYKVDIFEALSIRFSATPLEIGSFAVILLGAAVIWASKGKS